MGFQAKMVYGYTVGLGLAGILLNGATFFTRGAEYKLKDDNKVQS